MSFFTFRWFLLLLLLLYCRASSSSPAPSVVCEKYATSDCSGSPTSVIASQTGSSCASDAHTTLCVSKTLVAVTETESSCRPSFGGILTPHTCTKGGNEQGQPFYLNCTNPCNQSSVAPDCRALPARVGILKVWHSCLQEAEVAPPKDTIAADPSVCHAFPEQGASLRARCVSNDYMAVDVFSDQECKTKSEYSVGDRAMFIQKGGGCYHIQGSLRAFELTVIGNCDCGAAGQVDLLYRWTISGISSGTFQPSSLEGSLKSQTNLGVTVVAGTPAGGVLNITVRFHGVAVSGLSQFKTDLATAVSDGTISGYIQTAGLSGSSLGVTSAATTEELPFVQPPPASASSTLSAPHGLLLALIVATALLLMEPLTL